MERARGKRSAWWLMAGSLVLVGVLSVFGTAREEAKAAVSPATSTHAAATNGMEPRAANADVDVLEMQLD
jgi:hypothetical protein